MSVFDELNNDVKIRPTSEWMRKWYDIMNKELFGSSLGDCILRPFTTGKGSNGRTLGWFKMTGGKLYGNRNTGRLYKKDGYYPIEIKRDNFVRECVPVIELNANYSAPESSWINTLVHEMCHYYTYKDGFCPKQGHGIEFRQIAEYVSSKSHGYITIQRLASAEEMTHFDLDNDIKQKNQERKDRKKNRTTALVIVKTDGEVRLITTTVEHVISEVGDVHSKRNDVLFYGSCSDGDLIDFLFNKRYSKTMRTYRYWAITDKPWVKDLCNYKWEKYLGTCNTLSQALGISETDTEDNNEVTVNQQTDSDNSTQQVDGYNLGYKIIPDKNGYNLIDNRGHKSFANPVSEIWFDKNENKYYFKLGKFILAGQPGSWTKVNENKNLNSMNKTINEKLQQIIKETVEETIKQRIEEKNFNDESDFVSITPDMNLGLESPLEDRY